jgi:hypothetical protein
VDSGGLSWLGQCCRRGVTTRSHLASFFNTSSIQVSEDPCRFREPPSKPTRNGSPRTSLSATLEKRCSQALLPGWALLLLSMSPLGSGSEWLQPDNLTRRVEHGYCMPHHMTRRGCPLDKHVANTWQADHSRMVIKWARGIAIRWLSAWRPQVAQPVACSRRAALHRLLAGRRL